MKTGMRLLYLYPEEWTGRRAREVHTLSTCVALAESGVDVTLATAGGEPQLRDHLLDVADAADVPGLHLVALSRALGPIRSASIFSIHFKIWLRRQQPFDWAYTIHLKASEMLTRARIPYAYEAHEIFAETLLKNFKKRLLLAVMERQAVLGASLRVATSAALAGGLKRFALPDDFLIVPNAGSPPLERGISAPDGPFVYCGSIADWKGLDVAIQAARDARVPLKIVGGTGEEWQRVGEQLDTSGIAWQPRVPLKELPEVLAGARAGLIPTNPDTPSGRYSCPMKLFDYARCGLPVLSTALPSLQSLDVGPWCTQVASPTRAAWTDALRNFHHEADQAEAARAWSGEHTWAKRAELLKRAFGV
jgi:glycosyltransferase involved in cell wall biosynthesis